MFTAAARPVTLTAPRAAGDGDLVPAVAAVHDHLIRLAIVGAEVDVQRVEARLADVVDGDRVGATEGVQVDLLEAARVHRDACDVADELETVPVRRQIDLLGNVGAVEDHRVGTGLAVDDVAAIARIPHERVVPGAHAHDVVAALAVDRVVPGAADQRLGAGSADETIVSGAAVDRRRDAVGEDPVGLVDRHGVVAAPGVDLDVLDVGAVEAELGRCRR